MDDAVPQDSHRRDTSGTRLKKMSFLLIIAKNFHATNAAKSVQLLPKLTMQ